MANCQECTAWHLSRQFAGRAHTPVVHAPADPRPRHLETA
jgi:hypothetical protein